MKALLLRGLMREKRHWGQFSETLEASDNIEAVHTIDLPGIGEMADVSYPPTVGQACKILRKEFLKIKGHDDWVLAGNSLGGMISLEWAKKFPEDFRKIFVINTSCKNHAKVWQRLKPKAWKWLAQILKEKDPHKREQFVLKMVSNFAWKDPAIVEEWAAIARECPLDYPTALKQILSASLYKCPKKLPSNLVVIASKGDNMVSFKCSENLSRHHRLQLVLNDSAGHDIAIDDPDWLSQTISNLV